MKLKSTSFHIAHADINEIILYISYTVKLKEAITRYLKLQGLPQNKKKSYENKNKNLQIIKNKQVAITVDTEFTDS